MRKAIVTVALLGGALVIALFSPAADPGATPRARVVAAPAGIVSVVTTEPVQTEAQPQPQPLPLPPPDRKHDLHAMAHAAYVGWFDAIYRSDPGALAHWVATERLLEAGQDAMAAGTIPFTDAPTANLVRLTVDEVLRDGPDCVVLRTTDDVSRFIDAAVPSRSVIAVYWPDEEGRLRMATRWGSGTPATVWAADCARRPPRSVS